MSPLPGDFGVTTIHGNIGRLISIGEWLNGDGFGVYDHAFVVVGDGKLVQAEPDGARVANIDSYDPEHVLWSDIPLTDAQRDAITEEATRLVGTPYSFLDYAAIAAHRLRLWAPGLRDYVASTRHMICSQLVDWCYEQAYVELFDDGRWPGYVTPMDLANLILRKEEGRVDG